MQYINMLFYSTLWWSGWITCLNRFSSDIYNFQMLTFIIMVLANDLTMEGWCLQVQGQQALPSLPSGPAWRPEENRYVTQNRAQSIYKENKPIVQDVQVAAEHCTPTYIITLEWLWMWHITSRKPLKLLDGQFIL